MSKRKTPNVQQDLATPFSVMLFNNDKKELARVAKQTGVTLSVLVRLAVRNALSRKIYQAMAP